MVPASQIPGLPAIDNAAQLIGDANIRPPQELVVGLLHQGTKGMLASSSKAGKTWVLLDLALSVATGTKFLRWDTRCGKVLFLNFEIKREFFKERLGALIKRRQVQNAENLHVWNLRGQTADFDALLRHILREVAGKNYALIVLDPIYKAMIGRSENMASGVGMLCHQLERLAERTGAAILFAHHFTKGNPKKKAAIDRMSGSGVFSRDADTIVTLTEQTTPGCYTVECILRNLPQAQPFVVQWDYPVMVEREDLDPEDLKPAETAQPPTDEGVLSLLKERPLTTGEWQWLAEANNISRATFYRVKAILKERGYIQFETQSKTWSLVNNSPGVSRETETGLGALNEAAEEGNLAGEA